MLGRRPLGAPFRQLAAGCDHSGRKPVLVGHSLGPTDTDLQLPRVIGFNPCSNRYTRVALLQRLQQIQFCRPTPYLQRDSKPPEHERASASIITRINNGIEICCAETGRLVRRRSVMSPTCVVGSRHGQENSMFSSRQSCSEDNVVLAQLPCIRGCECKRSERAGIAT